MLKFQRRMVSQNLRLPLLCTFCLEMVRHPQKCMVRLQTDTGDTGVGINPNSALKDMQEHAVGKLFLETADYLILQAGCEEMLPALSEMLRPSCKVCVLIGCADPQKAAKQLRK